MDGELELPATVTVTNWPSPVTVVRITWGWPTNSMTVKAWPTTAAFIALAAARAAKRAKRRRNWTHRHTRHARYRHRHRPRRRRLCSRLIIWFNFISLFHLTIFRRFCLLFFCFCWNFYLNALDDPFALANYLVLHLFKVAAYHFDCHCVILLIVHLVLNLIKTTENFFDLLVAFAALKVRLQHHCGDMRLQFTVQEIFFMIA